MRLIDEKELINNRPENLNTNMSDDIVIAHNKGWNDCNLEWINLIEDQSTAYDVDKVCEELKFATRKGTLRACDFTGTLGTEDYKGAFVSTQQAIDIVRRGGIE